MQGFFPALNSDQDTHIARQLLAVRLVFMHQQLNQYLISNNVNNK